MLPQVNLIRAKNGDFLSFFESAGISGVLTAHGVWDELSIHVAKALIDVNEKKPVVLDIGSNMGTFTVPLAKHIKNKEGLIHCFEPQRIIYYQLCGNIFLNQLDNAFAHNIALSNGEGLQEIEELDYHKAWNIGAFSLVPGRNEQIYSQAKSKCLFLTLNEFEIEGKITLVKLDVEGMELEVLAGGIDKIKNDGYPPILFESLKNDPKSEKVFDLLISHGYKLMQYANEDWLAQHEKWNSEINISIEDGIISFQKIR